MTRAVISGKNKVQIMFRYCARNRSDDQNHLIFGYVILPDIDGLDGIREGSAIRARS